MGAPSLMVLTGVSGAADLLVAAPELRPTHIGADLAALTRAPDELAPAATRLARRRRRGTLVLSGDGDGPEPAVDALRALCAVAWEHGVQDVRADGAAAAEVLADLGLAEPPGR